MMTEEKAMKVLKDDTEGKNCEFCQHAKVCGILRAVSPLFNSFGKMSDGEEITALKSPINPLDLAKICKSYMPYVGDLDGLRDQR